MREELTKTDDVEALRRLAIEAWQRADALQKQAEALAQEKAVLVQKATELSAKNQALEDELAVLLQRISDLTCKLAQATGQDEKRQLELELRILRHKLAQHASEAYGSTSERMPKPEKDERNGKRDKKQTGHGPTEQPKLPIVPVVHPLDAADCMCPKCGGGLREMPGQFETSELIVSVQRRFVIEEHRRQKYHCTDCEHIETALGPVKLLPGGRYDLSFVVQVALDKYLDAIPLERQVRRMARAGLVVTSQTLWDQLVALYQVLLPTLLALKERVLLEALLFADETRWRMMGTGASVKWWLWTLTSQDAVYMELFPTRGAAAAKRLFAGYDGIVMADGYAVYLSLEQALTKKGGAQVDLDGNAEVLTNYTLALCWMHARRPFFKARKDEPRARRALDLIGQLYAVEDEATQAARGDPQALLEHRRRLRDERSRGIVAELELWQNSQRAMPKTQFYEGLQFLANHWTHLKRFLDDPRIPLDNGEAEREIRGPVVGRKNYYGNRSERGAAVAGLFFSLLATASKLGLNPEEYLTTAALRALLNPGTVTLPQDYKAELDATN